MENIEESVEELRTLFKKDKPIIIIGGVAGSGKTTMGNFLLHELNLDHSVGIGWLREAAKSKTTKEKDPALFTYSFRPGDETPAFEHFKAAAEAILPAVEACINRARREGQSLLIEGPMMIPGILKPEMYDIFICLRKPAKLEDHFKAMTTDTHTKREIFRSDLDMNVEIERELVRICEQKGVSVVPFIEKEERTTKVIKEVIHHFLVQNGEAKAIQQSPESS